MLWTTPALSRDRQDQPSNLFSFSFLRFFFFRTHHSVLKTSRKSGFSTSNQFSAFGQIIPPRSLRLWSRKTKPALRQNCNNNDHTYQAPGSQFCGNNPFLQFFESCHSRAPEGGTGMCPEISRPGSRGRSALRTSGPCWGQFPLSPAAALKSERDSDMWMHPIKMKLYAILWTDNLEKLATNKYLAL